ncbi:hypothetical protein BDZ89DRAFT_1037865 [Hymenopellis radicata]|nr:hypothetical protein BDZ89DRAFT_1037865 [Hymenopellis radicata]
MSSIRPANTSLASRAKVTNKRTKAGTFAPRINASATVELASNRASTAPRPSIPQQGEEQIPPHSEEFILLHSEEGDSDDFLTRYRDDTLARYVPKPMPPRDDRPKMQLQSACVPKGVAPQKVMRLQKRVGMKFAVNRNVKRRRLLEGDEAEGSQTGVDGDLATADYEPALSLRTPTSSIAQHNTVNVSCPQIRSYDWRRDLGSRLAAFPSRTMDDYLPELILLCGAGALNFFTTPGEEATRLEGLMFLRTTWLNNNDVLYITLTLRRTVGGKDIYAKNDPAVRSDYYDVRPPTVQILQPAPRQPCSLEAAYAKVWGAGIASDSLMDAQIDFRGASESAFNDLLREKGVLSTVQMTTCTSFLLPPSSSPQQRTSIPNRPSSQLVKEHLSRTEALDSAMTPSLDRFQHLAEVNTPPNHCERSELRSVISEYDSQLSDLHKILAEATQTVKSIEQRVDQVTLVLNSAKKITHPLRSVPNEILCLIFAQCVDYEAGGRNSLYTDQAPWTLSYVCSRWRRLVLSFPSLWTRPCFDFTIYATIGPVHRQMVYLMTLYIERSRALPLDITVQVMNDWIGHYALRHIIQATTARWKSAVLDLPLSEILLFKGCTFPLLESVKIQSRHPAIANEQDVDVFLSMPLLRSITITSESSLTFYSALMPWSQIVEYNCEHHAFSTENLDVLRQMTSLRSLVAYVWQDLAWKS